MTGGSKPLDIWLATVGEPLPGDPGAPRLLRAGLLAEVLRANGHRVTWWSSSFDHFSKRKRPTGSTVTPCGVVHALPSLGYGGHVSPRRLADHTFTAMCFARQARRAPAPSIIVASFPTIEFAMASARLARLTGAPLVVDIRDLWPDIFIDAFPERFRGAAKIALSPYRIGAQRSLRAACSIVATSDSFVDWGVAHTKRARTASDRMFPHAYDPPTLSNDNRSQAGSFWSGHGLDLDTAKVVAFAGTMVAEFDLATILQTARSLDAELPGVRFVLCGDGPALGNLQREARDLRNVILPGRVGRRDLAHLLDHTSVGLSPYLPRRDFLGTIGNKSIEYSRHGAVVFTTLSGVDIDRVLATGPCGLRYRHGDPADLRAHLLELFGDNAKLEAMRASARRVGEMFRIDTVYNEYRRHIEAIARPAADSKTDIA